MNTDVDIIVSVLWYLDVYMNTYVDIVVSVLWCLEGSADVDIVASTLKEQFCRETDTE